VAAFRYIAIRMIAGALFSDLRAAYLNRRPLKYSAENCRFYAMLTRDQQSQT
jgi:hypothetical protein